jgi:YYY domain-containing protein
MRRRATVRSPRPAGSAAGRWRVGRVASEHDAGRESRSGTVMAEAAHPVPAARPRERQPVERGLMAWLSRYWPEALILTGILVFGFALRSVNLNWDRGQHLHPDERFLSIVLSDIRAPESTGQYFDSANSPLNPYNHTNSFVYGTFPLFLTKAVGEWLDRDADGSTHRSGQWVVSALKRIGVGVEHENGTLVFDGGYNANLVGRFLSALMDTATILLAFELGRVLYGRRVGLVAAMLLAATVLHIQYSHFFGSEPYLAFFVTAVVYASVRVWKYGESWAYVACGAALGLALATKLSALPVMAIPALAILMRAWPQVLQVGARAGLIAPRGDPAGKVEWQKLLGPAAGGIAILLVALVLFRLFQPYAFNGPHWYNVFQWGYDSEALRPGSLLKLEFLKPKYFLDLDPRYVRDIDALRNLQSGADFPPNVQWANRPFIIFPLQNMAIWGLGLPLALAVATGYGLAGWRLIRARDAAGLLLMAWIAVQFLVVARQFNPTMRYLIGIYPSMAVLAALGIVWLWDAPAWARGRQLLRGRLARANRWAPGALAAAAGLLVLATLLWATAFTAGVYGRPISRVEASYWINENIPEGSSLSFQLWDDGLPLRLPGLHRQYRSIQLEPYVPDSPEKVAKLVDGLDQIDYVIESSNRLYDSIPRLPARYPATIAYYQALFDGSLGFELVAEFTNYPGLFGIDIPDQGAEEAFSVYDHPRVLIWKKTPQYSRERALAILNAAYPERAVNIRPDQGRTNGLLYTPEEAARQQAGGTWTEVFDPDGWASNLPWLWWLLWIQLAALAAVPWCTWLFRALPDRGYGLSKLAGLIAVVLPAWLLVAWGVTGFSGGLAWAMFTLALVAGAAVGWLRRDTLRADFRQRWKTWLAAECVFLVAFFAFLGLRAWNPDLWYHPTGGEKPMELAYLTAVTRSTHLPPYDPWFGGGYLNYYYMGWFFLAVPMRAFKIVPEVGFNLGVPTFASLAAVIAFSTVQNLVALSSRLRRRAGGDGGGRRIRPAIIAGVFGAVLLVAIGNLDSAHQTAERLQAVNTWALFEGVPVLGGGVGIVGGFYEWLRGAELKPYDWWRSSRVHMGTFDITEFPYWTFLFGDLHAHLMALPFFGLVIGTAVGYVVSIVRGLGRQGWVLAGALGLLVGLQRAVHTWDFPTAVALTVGAILVGQAFAMGTPKQRLLTAGAHLAIAGAVAVLLFLPYTSRSEVFDRGFTSAPETTKVNQYFAQFGVFVCFGLAFIAVRYREELRRQPRGNLLLSTVDGPVALAGLAIFVAGLLAFTWPMGQTVVTASAVILAYLLNLLWLEWRSGERDVGRVMATSAFFVAFGIGAGVDLFVVKNDIVRMNTVFKFSLQAWQLFAVGSAFAAWYVAAALWRADGFKVRPQPGRGQGVLAWGAAASAALLLLGAGIFVWSGTRERQQARFADLSPTLNGLAYLGSDPVFLEGGPGINPGYERITLSDDLPLIWWLRQNVEGSPVIVEAVGPLYHWTGRISWNTGLPAVIGWDNHQNQQRKPYSSWIGQRRADTTRFYQEADVAFAERYLRKYNVRYVVVGTEEWAFGTEVGLQKFERMPALEEVFREGRYAIYRVDQAMLPPAVQ